MAEFMAVSTGAILLLTGAQAAGKSTVGRAVAALADRGVFFDGDTFWQAVVSGRVDMDAARTPEAVEQLHLRYGAMAQAAKVYAQAGFFTVLADNVYGDDVQVVREELAPVRLLTVALTPSAETIVRRDKGRQSAAYAAWTDPAGGLLDAVHLFEDWVRATPADLQHDSTTETVAQTAATLFDWAAQRS